jgi:hypothetical protein
MRCNGSTALVHRRDCEQVPATGRVLWYHVQATAAALETVVPLSVREETAAAVTPALHLAEQVLGQCQAFLEEEGAEEDDGESEEEDGRPTDDASWARWLDRPWVDGLGQTVTRKQELPRLVETVQQAMLPMQLALACVAVQWPAGARGRPFRFCRPAFEGALEILKKIEFGRSCQRRADSVPLGAGGAFRFESSPVKRRAGPANDWRPLDKTVDDRHCFALAQSADGRLLLRISPEAVEGGAESDAEVVEVPLDRNLLDGSLERHVAPPLNLTCRASPAVFPTKGLP